MLAHPPPQEAGARETLEEAARLCPSRPEAWRMLALLHTRQGRLEAALDCAVRAVQQGPGAPENWIALGLASKAQGSMPEAEQAYRKALQLAPDSADAWFNLGNVLHATRRWTEAIACFEQAHYFGPNGLDALINLGAVHTRLGQPHLAIPLFNRVLEAEPANPEARWNRAMAELSLGNNQAGWRDYEARWEVPGLVKLGRDYSMPRWNGATPPLDTLLLAAEQGFGDTIQFIRYASALKQRGWRRIVVDAPAPLHRLLRTADGVSEVVSWNDPLPQCDAWLPLMSAAAMFFEDESHASRVPYLACSLPEPRLRSAHRRPRIGLVWSGNAEPDPERSIPTTSLRSLLSIEHVDWVCLQVGDKAKELAQIAPRVESLSGLQTDFLDTAHAMLELDLVLSVDTSSAHLAGALGLRVWTLLPWSADWRWMRDRSDSPWYPSMRLFRQTEFGNWNGVLEEVASEITRAFGPANGPKPTPEVSRSAGSVARYFSDALTAHRAGKIKEAELSYQRVLADSPDTPEAWQNLVPLLKDQGRFPEALAAAERLMTLAPNAASSWNNRGALRLRLDDLPGAIADFERALQLDPAHREARLNLAVALRESCHIEGAIQAHKTALERSPQDPHHHWNLGFCEMLAGRPDAAWPHLAWREKLPEIARESARFPTPVWNGTALNGRSLLLHAEQGLGDTLQFARYIPAAVHTAGGNVALECQQSLFPLLKGIAGILVHPRGDVAPPHDVHAPLMCLPRILGLPQPFDVPAVGYLGWPEASAPRHAARRPKIGIVWAGNPHFANDHRRSLSLGILRPLLEVRSIDWISLQKGEASQQIRQLSPSVIVEDLGSQLGDFLDTARALRSLDLLITSDTSVAHLAGALAVPVWLMLSHAPDWRWGLRGSQTPWYPTMTLFRQKARGDWNGVVLQLRQRVTEAFPPA